MPEMNDKHFSYLVAQACMMANTSPCRSKRGVIAFDATGTIWAWATNKPPVPFICDGSDRCKATCSLTAIHAEQHALLQLGLSARDKIFLHVKTVDGVLVPSGGPSCVPCSKLMLAAGVREMWLYHRDGWRKYHMKEFHCLSLFANQLPVNCVPATNVVHQS